MTALSAGTPPAPPAPGLPDAVEVRDVQLSDPLVEPLLAGLSAEYRARYHDLLTEDQHRAEMAHYAAEEFAPPVGALVLLLADGEPVAGGGYRRRDSPSARSALMSSAISRTGAGRTAALLPRRRARRRRPR